MAFYIVFEITQKKIVQVTLLKPAFKPFDIFTKKTRFVNIAYLYGTIFVKVHQKTV